MRRAVRELFGASNLDDEQLQIAIRVAHNNLSYRKANFDEFVKEGAHYRVMQYSHLYFLFANMIVQALEEESSLRFAPKDNNV